MSPTTGGRRIFKLVVQEMVQTSVIISFYTMANDTQAI